MTAREWLRAELDSELLVGEDTEAVETAWFDGALNAALAESGMSDRAIEFLLEVSSQDIAPAREVRPQVLAAAPGLAQRRQALGISVEEAAREVGIPPATYEAIENTPLRWRNVSGDRVAAYLARLGVSPAAFVRWVATQVPAGPQPAWGYRPGVVADRPVESGFGADDRERLITWGRSVLESRPDTSPPPGIRELLGRRWSPEAVNQRAAEIARSARERILATPMRTDAGTASAEDPLIALPAASGPEYPAFQFRPDGSPFGVVLEINDLLGAVDDPWGVADWWMTPNEILGARPDAMLHDDAAEEDLLRRAARWVLEAE